VILSFLHYIKRLTSSPAHSRIDLHPEIALLEAIVTIYTLIRAQTRFISKPLFCIEDQSGIAEWDSIFYSFLADSMSNPNTREWFHFFFYPIPNWIGRSNRSKPKQEPSQHTGRGRMNSIFCSSRTQNEWDLTYLPFLLSFLLSWKQVILEQQEDILEQSLLDSMLSLALSFLMYSIRLFSVRRYGPPHSSALSTGDRVLLILIDPLRPDWITG